MTTDYNPIDVSVHEEMLRSAGFRAVHRYGMPQIKPLRAAEVLRGVTAFSHQVNSIACKPKKASELRFLGFPWTLPYF